MIEYLIHYFT